MGVPGEPGEVSLGSLGQVSVDSELASVLHLVLHPLVTLDVGGPEDLVLHEVEERGDEGERCDECYGYSYREDYSHGADHGEVAEGECGESDDDGYAGGEDGLSSPHDGGFEGILV